MFALSLDLILGYAGIVTLGHAAFFGIGAYTVALASLRLGWTEPISGLIARRHRRRRSSASIVGWFILRYRGLTLLMLTIAFAAMLQEAGNIRSDFTGGYDGLPGLMFDPLLGHFQYDLYGHTNYSMCWRCWRSCSISCAASSIRRSGRRSPASARTCAACTRSARRCIAGWSRSTRSSAGIAGMAGALFTQTNAYVTLTVFDFDNSAKVMVMLILGGTGRLYGAFIGAVVYMVLEDKFLEALARHSGNSASA